MQLEERLEGVGGWLHLSEAVILERLAQDRVVMEIGSYYGRSAVAMAPVAKKVICIDYFRVKAGVARDETGRIIPPAEKPDTRDIFEQNVKPWRNKIEVHEMDSLVAVRLDWEPVGLLFIDGGHDYATVLSDCGFLKWVETDGHAVFHDASWKGVKQAVREIVVPSPEWERRPGTGNMYVFRHVSQKRDP